MSPIKYQQTSPVVNESGVKEMLTLVFRRKWLILGTIALFVAIAVVLCLILPKRWNSESQMVLVDKSGTATKSDYTSPTATGETIDTVTGELQSSEMVQRTRQWVTKQATAEGRPDVLANIDDAEFNKRLDIENPKMTNLMVVTFDAPSKEAAMTVANAVCDAFVSWKEETARKDTETIISNLTNQTAQAQDSVKEAEQALFNYQTSHHVVDATSEQSELYTDLHLRQVDVDTITQDANTQQAHVDSLTKDISAANKIIGAGGNLRDDSLTLSLQTQLNNLEMQRADAASKYTPEYPGILPELDAQIADVKQRLNKALAVSTDGRTDLRTQSALNSELVEAKVTLATTRARLATAVSERDAVASKLTTMPSTDEAVTRLKRNLDLATANYTNLNTALASAKLDLGKITPNVVIIERATEPELPAFPNMVIGIALAIILGGLTSLLIINTSEQRDIFSVEDAKRLLPGTVVGVMRKLTAQEKEMIGADNTPLHVIEAMALARVNVLLQSRAHPFHSVLVTSATPTPNKSIIAAELARSFANTGRRVLLVDTGVPVSKKDPLNIYGEEDSASFADVLAGTALIHEAIVASGTPGLSILRFCGRIVNPTDLLSNPGVEAVFNELRQHADMIVIDAPDCSVSADALQLMTYADRSIQVVDSGRVDIEANQNLTLALANTGKPTSILLAELSVKQYKKDKHSCVLNGAIEHDGSYIGHESHASELDSQMMSSRDLLISMPNSRLIEK